MPSKAKPTLYPLTDTQLNNFFNKVEKVPNGCWEWSSHLMNKGYGQVGLNNKLYLAHRISYELVKGPIPEKLVLDHLCRNRRCVNPDHLEAVTQRTNIIDRGTGKIAQAARRISCVNGHPYNAINTQYITKPNGYTSKRCRICRRIPISAK